MRIALPEFIEQLMKNGCARVDIYFDEPGPEALAQAAALLQTFHVQDSLNLPASPPPFHAPAALWAAQHLMRLQQYLLVREADLPANGIPIPRQWMDDAAAIYSADLSLRYLPPLQKLARSLAPADPLLEVMEATAQAFPFSHPEQPVADPLPQVDAILDCPPLRITWLSRLITHKNESWLQHPRVKALVAEALGGYAKPYWPALAPATQTL